MTAAGWVFLVAAFLGLAIPAADALRRWYRQQQAELDHLITSALDDRSTP